MLDLQDKPAKPAISQEETDRRRKALDRAYAHNRLEGLVSTEAAKGVFEAFVRGDIEIHEVAPRIKALQPRP